MLKSIVDSVRFTIAAGAECRRPASDTVEVVRAKRTLRLKRLDPGVAAALCRIADGPVTQPELEKVARAADPVADLGRLVEEVHRLTARSLLQVRCVVAGAELLRATPLGPLARFDFPALPGQRVTLSRFAYMRREGQALLVESPTSYVRVEVRATGMAELLARLAGTATPVELAAGVSALSPEEVSAATAFLHGVGVLTTVDEYGNTAEDALPEVQTREFHDVLMHAASRAGLSDTARGATFRFHGAIDPWPAARDLPEGPRTSLPIPDRDWVAGTQMPLARAVESRRSVRIHGTGAIRVRELGEFLFRTARVESMHPVDEAAGRWQETSRRPYPSAGAAYDLELYLTIRDSPDLADGIYHYDPLGHQLTQVCDRPESVRLLLLEAGWAANLPAMPYTLITMASRFARLSWKYQGIAYALTLKNVGVLQHAMYLTATAMGLAPCALGRGESAVFASATGLDPMVESSVGEFLLGTREAS